MIPMDLTPEEQVEEKPVVEIEVNPYEAKWKPYTVYKPLEYRILFENKTEFQNMGLLNQLRDILEQHLGVEEQDYFIEYWYDANAEFGIELYTESIGWMVMMKLVDPDQGLPEIKRIEKRVR